MSENNTGSGDYFVGVLVLSLAILATGTVQLVQSFQQRNYLQESLMAEAKKEREAETVGSVLQGMSRDLVTLSATSPGARQVVQEFGIRVNQAAPKSTAK